MSLRTGPGVQYPLVAQLGPDLPVTIVGKSSEEGEWYQLCCINNSPAWVAAQAVEIIYDASEIPVAVAQPPPSPTHTPLPTNTPIPSPTPPPTPYVFGNEPCKGPERTWTDNQFLTIWVKLSIGPCPGLPTTPVPPAEGYYIKVLFEGFERKPTFGEQPSAGLYTWSQYYNIADQPENYNYTREYNYKYEYHPPDLSQEGGPDRLEALGDGTWTVWVVDGSGNQLSNKVTFETRPRPLPSQPEHMRLIWIHWSRIR